MDVTLNGVPQKLYRYDVDDTPVNAAVDVPPSSNWAFDHAADYFLHTMTVRKTSDETLNNDNALQNDDELFLALAANEIWAFYMLIKSSSHANADIRYDFAAPAGATLSFNAYGRSTAAASYTVFRLLGDTALLYGAGVGVEWDSALIGVVINGATPGNLQFRWAQVAAHASDTVVYANSYIVATRLL